MTMFGNLYKGELRKAFNIKTAIIFLVIFVVGLAIITPLFKLLDVAVDDELFDYDEELASVSDIYTEESVNLELGLLKVQLAELKAEKEKLGYDYYRSETDMIFYVETRIAELEFIRDNALYGEPLATYLGGYGVSGGENIGFTADDYINTAFQLFFLLWWIYALVVGAGSFADEYKNRTLKLLLMRPVTRNQVTSAKLLATLTVVTVAYAVMGLAIVALGYSVFDISHTATVFSFNGGAFTVQDRNASVPIVFALYYIPVATMAVLGFTIGALTRKRTLGIVVPILANALSSIFTVAGVGRFFIVDAMDFMQFAGVSDSVTAGGNAFISLGVLVVYLSALIVGTYAYVNRRDVA